MAVSIEHSCAQQLNCRTIRLLRRVLVPCAWSSARSTECLRVRDPATPMCAPRGRSEHNKRIITLKIGPHGTGRVATCRHSLHAYSRLNRAIASTAYDTANAVNTAPPKEPVASACRKAPYQPVTYSYQASPADVVIAPRWRMNRSSRSSYAVTYRSVQSSIELSCHFDSASHAPT